MKKILLLIVSLAVVIGLFSGCGAKKDDKTIKVGASSTPHAEILESVKEDLAAKGYTLEVVIYDDYVLPNKALADGTLDANYFSTNPILTVSTRRTEQTLRLRRQFTMSRSAFIQTTLPTSKI